MRAGEVIEALRRRYRIDDGEWLFWTEAWRIDAYAIRCWRSGPGFRRVALEVKCSRSDFLAECRKPAKRQNALDVSHEFYFVTPHGLVQPHEVPRECGLMYVRDGRARVAKKAPFRQPRPFTLSEVLYLMRIPLYREGILEMRRRVLVEHQIAEDFAARSETLDQQVRRASTRLEALNGHLITEGSTWRGRWQPHSFQEPVEGVDVYVERVEPRWLIVRRLDNGESCRIWTKGDLLMNYSPLDIAAVA